MVQNTNAVMSKKIKMKSGAFSVEIDRHPTTEKKKKKQSITSTYYFVLDLIPMFKREDNSILLCKIPIETVE